MCKCVKTNGKKCQAKPVKGSEYCFRHNKDFKEQSIQASRNGGLNRRLQGAYGDAVKLTITQALIREIREEVGITLVPSQFSLSHIMHRKSDDIRVDFFFRINSWKGAPKNMEPEKCNELVWTPIDKLPKDTIPYIAHAIHCVHNNILYSEFGWT